MEVPGGCRDTPLAVAKPHAEAAECLRGGCDPLGNPGWSRVLTGACGPVERGAHARADFLAGFVTFSGAVNKEL